MNFEGDFVHPSSEELFSMLIKVGHTPYLKVISGLKKIKFTICIDLIIWSSG